jgi:hypothetical protein
VKRERPINADLPAPEAPQPEPAVEKKPAATAPPRPEPEPKAAPVPKPKSGPTPKSKSKPKAASVPKSEPKPKAEPAPKSAPKAKPKKRPRPPRRKRQRQPRPLTPFVLAGLVLIAVVFIVAAVLGGTGGSSDSSESPAPAPVLPSGGGSADEGSSQSAETLGYPAFATNNTTRIGGSDPASTAAAVALAVFPSTTDSQRPKAVTLVGEDDWAGAIAASVLMAEPIRAPVLISGTSLPDVTSEALESLAPTGVGDDAGTQLYTVGAVATPGESKTHGVGGDSAATQAAEIAKLRDQLFGSAPDHIVVAPSSRPDIAMPAAAWAARSGDPVLFAGGNDLPAATATALRRHTKVPVYVLGPSSAISSEVLRGIGKISKRVKRVSGEDPVANAIAFARYGDDGFGWQINDPGHGFVLARSDSPPVTAAAAAALSGSGTWGPLLLSDDATKLPAELRSYFLDVKPGYTDNPTRAFYNHVWVIGDQEAIDLNQQAEVNELAELAKIGGGG